MVEVNTRRATRSRVLALGFVLVAAVAAILLSAKPAPAAEFTVTRTDDPGPDRCEPDDCSLREAVIAANGSGGSVTIVLPRGTYSLTISARFGDFEFPQVGDLDIRGSMDIVGRGGPVSIEGEWRAAEDRIFDIHNGSVSMRKFRITGGRAQRTEDDNGDGTPDFAKGGGIRIAAGAALSASDVTLDRNTAESFGQGGAIFNEGDLSLVRARVSHNDSIEGFSGGIQTEPGATTSLYDTEVHSNAAVFGGGLGAYGGTIVERSAIYLNRAGLGGGIRAAGGSSFTSLTNVTLAHNRTTGNGSAIQARNGPGFTFNNVTVARNTADSDRDGAGNAAVFVHRDNLSTSMELRNTILAANEDGSPGTSDVPDCQVFGGATIRLEGYDLLGNRAGCALDVTTGAEGNQVGTPTDPIDPLLEIGIDSNGGPTSTLALLPGSPAIDAGGPARPGSGTDPCFPSDQRGAPRSDCDIGAYELVKCLGAVVNVVGTSGPDALRGGAGNDAILGLGGADRIFGGGDDDAICAGGGNDLLRGGDGNDRTDGGPGNDTLYGDASNDRLVGGVGRDVLNGGKGKDRLFGKGGNDSLNTRDRVRGNDLANGGAGRDACRTDPRDRRVSCT